MLKKIGDFLFFFRWLRPDFILPNQLRKGIPPSFIKRLKRLRSTPLPKIEMVRIRKNATKLLGPEYPPLHKKIEIDITYHCNLKCLNCNRFLDFAPSEERMAVVQIKKFIEESVGLDRKWDVIFLNGGEPISHPDFVEIANLIVSYKNGYSPKTAINLMTSGVIEDGNNRLAMLPSGINVINSQKGIFPPKHYPVTVAPIDLKEYKDADFSNGCSITHTCAMGLNMYGYYQCTVAAAIDRIFGLNIGRKSLPTRKDNMIDLYRAFCGYCGHFLRYGSPIGMKLRTASWERAIDNYFKSKPSLTLY